MSTIQAKKIVKKYINKLKAENNPFQAVYLFGSHAQNKANKKSDIDVAIISKKLEKNWNRNEDKLWRYTLSVDSKIEPLGFTPKDFKDTSDPMVHEIKTTGIKIA